MPGPFYFAFVDPDTEFDSEVHNVEDLVIGNFKVEQTEGDFAAMTLEIRNPRNSFGLLAGKVWAWLSWDDGEEIIPLFYGRLIGIPDDIIGEVIKLEFIARPVDYIDQKEELAETLKVAPYYDPIWIDEGKVDDPDTVLEARSELWAYDRISHEVTTSNILVGEDGIQDFVLAERDAFYEGVKSTLNQVPLQSVSIDGIVNWTQVASGEMPVLYQVFVTGTGKGLVDDWPKPGASVGGGWTVAGGTSAVDAAGIEDIPDDKYKPPINNLGIAHPIDTATLPDEWIFVLENSFSTGQTIGEDGFIVPMYHVQGNLVLRYDAARERTEHVRFVLRTHTQPIITAADETDLKYITMTARDVGEPLAENGEIPIVNRARRSYFPTTRGERSVQYLIAIARAHLALRSRAVEVEWPCKFERAIALSCRMNARLYDPRLPGGNALGKIIRYSFECTNGLMIGHCRIGCAIGYGGSVAAVPGTPDYVTEGYVTEGWQTYTGKTIVFGAGDVSYSMPVEAINDDGLVLTSALHKGQMVSGLSIYSVGDAGVPGLTQEEVSQIINNGGTRIEFTLKPVEGGPFESAYDIFVSELEIAKMIDLEFADYFGTFHVVEAPDVAAFEG